MSSLNISQKDYFILIEKCKRVDPVNYLDIAHDHILTGKSIRRLMYHYYSPFSYDINRNETSCKPCNKCNEIKPISLFRILSIKGNYFTKNTCVDCESIYFEKYYKNYRVENKEKLKEKFKTYYQNNKDRLKVYRENYLIENKESIKEKSKAYYQKN